LQDGCFPRFHRRGLIEASITLTAGSSRIHVFRGFTAAASLKPSRTRSPGSSLPWCFPRFHRRGLIEGS